jgi:enoyl-CoA hydratase/carnithine racemase
MSEFEFFTLEMEGPIATVTLSRPDRMNAMGGWALERNPSGTGCN